MEARAHVSRLGLSWDVEQRAVAILQEAKTRGLLRGRNPRGLSGTAVYIAAKESQKNNDRCITQKRISEVSGISGTTIRTLLSTFKHHNITTAN